jgi:hypothetical protein
MSASCNEPNDSFELQRNKTATASSNLIGNEPSLGNDNDLSTRWCANEGTYPQWWRVDLGASHALSAFSVRFEFSDRTYTYQVETSRDDATYTLQASVSGTGVLQLGTFPANLAARYVRITVTSGLPGDTTHPTWASFFEFSVTGT